MRSFIAYRTILFRAVVTLTLLCAFSNILQAQVQQQAGPSPVIKLRQKAVYQVQTATRWADSMNRSNPVKDPLQVVIRLDPKDADKAALEARGIYLKEYISDNSWTAIMKPANGQLQAPASGYIVTVDPRWKIASMPVVSKGAPAPQWMVSCYPDISEEAFRQQVSANGGQLLYSPMADKGFYEILLATDKIQQLAKWYGIRSIGISGKDQPLNFESTAATKTSVAHFPFTSGGYNLMGDSITIGVGDNTSGLYNIDLIDRIINYNPEPYSNHGIHVTGTVGATGTMDPRGEGFAPHATIINNTGRFIWANTGTMKQQHNMSVTNNSYTIIGGFCSNAGVYDANAQALDTLSLIYPEILHVFAAGNDGSMACYPYSGGFGTVTGNYQPAKNVLTVAQCDKQFQWGINSSKGPVKDGRLKPEITAIGTGVISTRFADFYLTSGGTSMASPQVAGAAALLQQQYKRMYGNAYPPSDLTKALLMNGATDIGNPGPDYTFGFGVMNMKRSLDMLANTHYVRNNITNGTQQTTNINIPANTAQLKVMLYWHDRPASVLAATQLVNNLDLEVVDAGNNVVRPLILNPLADSVNKNAKPGVDILNNVEQVVINNPVNGPYTIRVKGTQVPAGPQTYAVVYDFIPAGVNITYPLTASNVMIGIPMRVYWDAAPGAGSFTLEFSDNNGTSWTKIDSLIPSTQRTYQWSPPTGTSSERCLMRLTRGAEVFTTGNFVTNTPPSVLFDSVQCPGYINIRWVAIANATAYQVLRKRGPYLQVDTLITDTAYSFSGLSLDSTYYVAVRPFINGVPGYRSQSVKRVPNTGTCNGSFSDGDLMIERLESPATGRMFTSSQLGNNVPLKVRIRNLDNNPADSCRISYSMNGAAWQSQVIATPLATNSSQVITIPTALNMSATGNYNLRIAVTNLALADKVKTNDSIKIAVRHLENNPVNIYTGFTEDFEAAAALSVAKDTMGFTPNQHWDFANSSDTGLLRTQINSDITISGNRSVSLSSLMFTAAPITNTLTGTFNTTAYNVANDELRLEFDYKMHGYTHFTDSNRVWVRAADSLAWRPVYSYNRDAVTGTVINSGSISLTDALIAAGKNFTAGLQIRFGQQDTTTISLNNYGTGTTIDNIKLYAVSNDVTLDSILIPDNLICGLDNSPVTVRVYNGVMQAQSNIRVSYRIDNGPVYTDTITSLAGKTSVIHTCSQLITGIVPGIHLIQAWVTAAGDTYPKNDTLTKVVRNQPLISSFPYLENFEANDGYWFTAGSNSSWQYGTPSSANVTRAASGTKAWKTNLNGTYNDYELSYLYSPCFNIAGLTQPMLSFSTVMEIENCAPTVCDGAWMEYTTNNGQTWTKLGAAGQGQSWYTNASVNVWDQEGDYRWHVTSIPLPVTSQTLRLRFVLYSDPGVDKEGISIDDIHIYNRDYPLYNFTGVGPITQSVSGNNYINFISAGKILAQIKPDGQNIGATDISLYTQAAPLNDGQRYYLPESFTVNCATSPSDSVTARFYVTDNAVNSLVNASGCIPCSKPKDVYRLGIAKYDDTTPAKENGSLSDNTSGTWTYYAPSRIKWVPYDVGYFAEVRLPSFSEIWFNDGTSLSPLPVKLVNFGLEKKVRSAQLNWELQQTDGREIIQLQRSGNASDFNTIYTTATQPGSIRQSYLDADPLTGVNYYRLAIAESDGTISYSNTLSATFGDGSGLSVYPNPAKDKLEVSWADANVPVTLDIHNLMGQRIYNHTLTGNHITIPLDYFANGIYLLNIRQGNSSRNMKFTIEK